MTTTADAPIQGNPALAGADPYGTVLSDGYIVSNKNDGFLHLVAPDFKKTSLSGWKAYLSVSAHDLPRAWDIASNYTIKHALPYVEVATPATAQKLNDPQEHNSGKTITLHLTKNTSNWAQHLKAIEALLVAQDIKPGPKVQSKDTQRIDKSAYGFYRNDGSEKNAFMQEHMGEQWDPSMGTPDPFKPIEVEEGETKTMVKWTQVTTEKGYLRLRTPIRDENEGKALIKQMEAKGFAVGRLSIAKSMELGCLTLRFQSTSADAQAAEREMFIMRLRLAAMKLSGYEFLVEDPGITAMQDKAWGKRVATPPDNAKLSRD